MRHSVLRVLKVTMLLFLSYAQLCCPLIVFYNLAHQMHFTWFYSFIGCKNLGSQDVMQLNNEELKSGDQRQYPAL